jgi:two-component system sensor histidine kinase TctE
VSSSIGRNLVFWLAVPLTLLALCGALAHYFNAAAPELIGSDRRLREAASAVARRLQIRDGRLSVAPAGAARQDQGPPADQGTERYAVRDAAQRLLAGDARLPAPAAGGTAAFSVTSVDGRRVRTLSSRVDTALGPVTVTVADYVHGIEPAARFGFLSTLLWDFIQLDVTLVLVWVGIQLGLRPLKKLRDEVAERSPSDLRPIVESSVPREMAPLAATLNRLFGMLRTAVQSQQQFIANTAHQLRTPITGMQAQLDLLVAEPAATPVKERLLTLQEGVRQLSHSANQLLSLARADPAANVAAKNQPVQLDSLAGEVAARFFDRALKSNIDLGVELAPAMVMADPSLLDDLLSNLVDNALKYTPPGGRVTVSVGRQGATPFVAVEDDGCGIPEAERQHVRQRFYRVPNSPGHGSGLGLAIVEEIARLYDAAVAIGDGAGGRGTLVMVQFPSP